MGRLLTHCLSLLTVEGSEKTVDEVAGEETGDDLNPSVEEPHERSLISHDDEDMNTVPPTENDMTASLEQSTGLEDENIDHIQKQLFSEEDSVNRRSWHGRSSVDFTHLKVSEKKKTISFTEVSATDLCMVTNTSSVLLFAPPSLACFTTILLVTRLCVFWVPVDACVFNP